MSTKPFASLLFFLTLATQTDGLKGAIGDLLFEEIHPPAFPTSLPTLHPMLTHEALPHEQGEQREQGEQGGEQGE